MATKRKSKGKKRTGVAIIAPNAAGRTGWRMRYLDPDELSQGKNKYRFETFPSHVTTKEQREAHARLKADELLRRRIELEGGALPKQGKGLAEAVDEYFAAHPDLSERTKEDYRAAADKLIDWTKRRGIKSCDDVDRVQLMHFRTSLVNEPKRSIVAGKGVGRGKRTATTKRRSPERINTEMRKCGTVLRYLIDLAYFPKLSHDDMRRAFKALDVPKERVEFLEPHELRKLLEAALRHDADVHSETREEHAGLRAVGTTPKYEPIAPFVVGLLLTGMRLGEGLRLQWDKPAKGEVGSYVDLETLDSYGRKVGAIHLSGATTKTRTYRKVSLRVSPALRSLLAALQLASGGKGSVFGLTEGQVEAAAKRLREEYGAPENFTWQSLRRSCATYLSCAPGIFGASSATNSAKQLGHSVTVAEKKYVGLVEGISEEAKTLEDAMLIGELVAKVIERVGAPAAATSTMVDKAAVKLQVVVS